MSYDGAASFERRGQIAKERRRFDMQRRPRVIGVVTVAGAEDGTGPWMIIVTLRQ